MSRTLVLIGTRKGCFVLESDADRRDWSCAARSARAGPSTTPSTTRARARSTPPPRASGTARPSGAAAISARPGSTRARASPTRTAARSSRRSRRSPPAHGRLLVGVEAPGIFESRDGGATFSLLSTLAGQPGSEGWDDPANQPPGHLGISGIDAAPATTPRASGRSCRASASSRRPTAARLDAAQPRPPRRLAARRTRRSASACTSSCARRRRRAACTSRTTSACTAATTAAHSWTEITEGLPTRVRLRAPPRTRTTATRST